MMQSSPRVKHDRVTIRRQDSLNKLLGQDSELNDEMSEDILNEGEEEDEVQSEVQDIIDRLDCGDEH